MSRFLLLASALVLSGCSLLWTPNQGPDASIDAFALDANLDAHIPPDAGVDAWAAPAEICNDSARRDEDGDGSSNCIDSDCFGHASCCVEGGGAELDFTALPNWTGTASVNSATGMIDFGDYDYRLRNRCVPLANGAVITADLTLAPQAGTFGLVLSPARGPSAKGFIDELAVRITSAGVQITRAGVPQVLANACMLTAPTAYPLTASDTGLLIKITLRPGVVSTRPVLLATVELTACGSPVVALQDAVIDVRDLITTTDELTDSCDGNRGLFLALEGSNPVGAPERVGIRTLAAGERNIPIRALACVAPGEFASSPAVVTLPSLLTAPRVTDFAYGGIGAPDLRGEGGSWELAYDGAQQPRASELFGLVDFGVGIATSGAAEGPWTSSATGTSRATVDNAREPSLLSSNLAFARRNGTGWDVFYGNVGAASAVLTEADCRDALIPCSFREPVLVPGASGDTLPLLLFRYDQGATSTLGLARIVRSGTDAEVQSYDLLGPTIGNVRAADALREGDYIGLWVWSQPRGSERSLHFFSAESSEGLLRFTPFAGNPVLRSSDLQERCEESACVVDSFAVQRTGSAPTMLRFLFARSRTALGATTYEFIARTQLAPPGLE